MNYIDFSQFDMYKECPLKWAEKYAWGMRKVWEGGQRDDALALGSLVHAGLDVWHGKQVIEVPSSVVQEIDPTPECLREAQRLLVGYAQKYGTENFGFERCEEPLEFEIGVEDWRGVAKVDRYFRVDEGQVAVESGLGDGARIWLQQGWWLDEKKTKSPGIDRGWWMKEWVNKMQASFQILALQEKIQQRVAGVLITVMEKEDTYKPKRKCKGCGLTLEMSTYRMVPGGRWECGMCGVVQELSAGKPREDKPPQYFRMETQRTQKRLELDKQEIAQVAQEMKEIKEEVREPRPNRRSCVNMMWKRECEYFVPHSADLSAEELGSGFEHEPEPLKYIEIKEIVA